MNEQKNEGKKQKDGQTDRQTDRQTARQKDRHFYFNAEFLPLQRIGFQENRACR